MTMRFADSDTQALIRSTARSYFADQYPWERLYAIERGDAALGQRELGELAELGWLALFAPEALGGGGADLLDAAVVVEECGYAAVPAPISVSNIVADVVACGAPSVQRHLSELAKGRAIYTFNESYRTGSRRRLPSIDNGRLEGTLEVLPFGEAADLALTPLVRDGATMLALISLGGCKREPIQLLDRRGYAHVTFETTALDTVEVLATGTEAEALQERCNALVTALSIIELAGMMQRVLEMTVEYISHRVQFGQPIGKFQAARHRAAELLMQAETVRWSAYHALWRFQKDPSDMSEIWLARHWAIRASERVFEISHLLHGGVGVGAEYPLHLYTQSLAAVAVRGGTMNEMVARTLAGLHVPAANTATAP